MEPGYHSDGIDGREVGDEREGTCSRDSRTPNATGHLVALSAFNFLSQHGDSTRRAPSATLRNQGGPAAVAGRENDIVNRKAMR